MCNFQLWMCVDESDGCGRVSPAPVCLCARNERKGAKRMVGEVDGVLERRYNKNRTFEERQGN